MATHYHARTHLHRPLISATLSTGMGLLFQKRFHQGLLERLDSAAPRTRATLDLTGKHPHRRTGDHADMLWREKLEFEEDVQKKGGRR